MFSIIFVPTIRQCPGSVAGVCNGCERKVRAAKGILLPKIEAIGDSRCRQMTGIFLLSKDEEETEPGLQGHCFIFFLIHTLLCTVFYVEDDEAGETSFMD